MPLFRSTTLDSISFSGRADGSLKLPHLSIGLGLIY